MFDILELSSYICTLMLDVIYEKDLYFILYNNYNDWCMLQNITENTHWPNMALLQRKMYP